jgi:hypothetical protein
MPDYSLLRQYRRFKRRDEELPRSLQALGRGIIVKYERDGERKNRYIQMPSKFGDGDEEFEKAKDLFRSVGLPLEQT